MGSFVDLTWKRFGRLFVTSRAADYVSPHGQHKTRWNCLCDCGRTTVVTSGVLKRGEARSCGCLHQELRHSLTKTHGETGSRLHHIWCGMRQRCSNKKHHAYNDYGGRGIQVCKEWESFPAFRDWAIHSGYADTLSIDRIDNDSGYSPENCRWVSQKTQSNNQRSNVLITFNGKTQTRAQWAEELGLSASVIRDRMERYGWDTQRALTTPIGG